MARIVITVADRDPGDVETELRGQLYAFNVATTGIDDGALLVVTARAEADEPLVGGIFGWTWGGTCFVDLLHVRADRRGLGVGSALLAAAEGEAAGRGCGQVVLATHTFQAPRFYAARGYREYGRVEGYPRGHAQVQLVKDLAVR